MKWLDISEDFKKIFHNNRVCLLRYCKLSFRNIIKKTKNKTQKLKLITTDKITLHS